MLLHWDCDFKIKLNIKERKKKKKKRKRKGKKKKKKAKIKKLQFLQNFIQFQNVFKRFAVFNRFLQDLVEIRFEKC